MAWHTVSRFERNLTVTIAKTANLSEEIDMSDKALLALHMPSAWTAASIGFKASPTPGGTFQPVYNSNGVLVQISSPTASKTYIAPAEIAACRYIKLWSQDGSGANKAQGAERAIGVELKA